MDWLLLLLRVGGKNWRPLAGGEGEAEPLEEEEKPAAMGESFEDSEAVEEKPDRLPRRKG